MHLAAHSLFTECVLHAQLRPQSYIHARTAPLIFFADSTILCARAAPPTFFPTRLSYLPVPKNKALETIRLVQTKC